MLARTSADAASRPRHLLFRSGTVACFASSYAWLSSIPFLLLGLIVAILERPSPDASPRLLVALQYGVLLLLSNVVHTLGHLAAARLLGIRTNTVLITATVHVNSHVCVYGLSSRWRHIGRALGGPAANLALGLAALLFSVYLPVASLRFLAIANLFVSGSVVLPIPRLDGWVIWGELLGFRRRLPPAPSTPAAT